MPDIDRVEHEVESSHPNSVFAAIIDKLDGSLPREVVPPILIWSFGFDADEVLAVYAALRTYLRALLNQEGEEDLEMLARIIKIMTQIRPSAVKASKALSLEAVRSKE